MTTPDLPTEKMRPARGESVADAYFEQMHKLLEGDKDRKRIALTFLGSKHFIGIFEILTEMDCLFDEMRFAVSEFTGRGFFLGRILTIEHLAMAMKVYVISWRTLLDFLARLINAVFNLGIADRDIHLGLVLNNAHVKSSRIPDMLQEYERTSLINDLRKRRNDAVHRGKIPDPDVEQILGERNKINSRRSSFLQTTPISAEEHKRQLSHLQERLGALAKAKQEMWEKHRQQTVAMIAAAAGELADKTIKLYKRETI